MTTSALQDQLFADVAGYSLSALGKIAIDREDDPALTYGECTPETVEQILSLTGAGEGDVLCDLGSGTGKLVIYAAFLAPLKKSVGIELLPELHDAAQMVAKRYRKEIQPQLTDARRDTQLECRLGDLFDADISDATIVVSHCCTCFNDTMMQRLSDKLETCKPGTRIVTVTRPLNSSAFEPLSVAACEMGWGQATLNVYRRR